MVDEVLIERTGRCHIDRRGRFPASTGPADLLPGAGDRTGVSAEYRRVQVTDIDTKLEGIRADHAPHRTVAQSVLDLAPLQRQVATAITANRSTLPEAIRERLLQVAEQNLNLQAGTPEDDGLHSAPQERFGDALALQRRGAAECPLPIHHPRGFGKQGPWGPPGAPFGPQRG